MWEKIVLNLLSNAFKFTFDGEIRVSLHRSGDAVQLRVADTGTGIPHGQQERVFERFHRIESARGRTHEGSGIGLALVQELTRLHGGSVRVESVLGRGSTFVITIPLGRAHLPSDQIREPETVRLIAARPFVDEALRWLPDPETAHDIMSTISDDAPDFVLMSETDTASQSRPKVLLADDNADIRNYLSRLLATRFRVEAVIDGMAALVAARRQPPDLILTDVMMPQLDGFGLLAEIRADPKLASVPVVMLSARAGEEARVEGLEAGADDYLIKPFSARELMARVESNLKLANLRRNSAASIAAILESMQDGFHTVDKNYRFTRFNASARRTFAAHGLDADALIGKHLFDEVLPAARGQQGGQTLITAMTERRSVAVETYYLPWKRWFHIRHDPTSDGGVATFFLDITEQKEAEERQRLLLDELNHRVKNTLAIAQSIATQTARTSPTPDVFAKTFSGRLAALAGAHTVLTRQTWQYAPLEAIVAQAIAPFRIPERIRIDGPDRVILPSGHAVTMALILHELATNALKYGALSTAIGFVDIRWLITGDGDIQFSWSETGGPAIDGSPERTGFGTRLVDMSALQLNAHLERVFAPTGLHFAMRFQNRPNTVIELIKYDSTRATERNVAGRAT
jgi:PAS domain S-box-containing protein